MKGLILALILAQQPIPKSAMSGIVLKAGSTQAIAGARITVTRLNAATGAAQVQDGEGNFDLACFAEAWAAGGARLTAWSIKSMAGLMRVARSAALPMPWTCM